LTPSSSLARVRSQSSADQALTSDGVFQEVEAN